MSEDLSKLNKDQLLQLAKNVLKEEDDPKLNGLSSCRRFLIAEDIVEGKEKIPALVIYARYNEWCYATGETPVSTHKFFNNLQLYLERKPTGKGIFYMVNPSGFNLSPEYFIEAKKKYLPRKRTSNGKKEKKESKDE